MKKIIFFFLIVSLASCKEGKTYFVKFDDVNGLKKGAKVTTKGMEIGTVEDLKLRNDKVIATVMIDPEVQIGKDSKFNVAGLNFFSGPSLKIEMPEKPEFIYKAGDTLPANSSPDMFNSIVDSAFNTFAKPLLDSMINNINITVSGDSSK
jgi:phospholipid/cholesterol/gamma-HCH transport system substrate-binding protein